MSWGSLISFNRYLSKASHLLTPWSYWDVVKVTKGAKANLSCQGTSWLTCKNRLPKHFVSLGWRTIRPQIIFYVFSMFQLFLFLLWQLANTSSVKCTMGCQDERHCAYLARPGHGLLHCFKNPLGLLIPSFLNLALQIWCVWEWLQPAGIVNDEE